MTRTLGSGGLYRTPAAGVKLKCHKTATEPLVVERGEQQWPHVLDGRQQCCGFLVWRPGSEALKPSSRKNIRTAFVFCRNRPSQCWSNWRVGLTSVDAPVMMPYFVSEQFKGLLSGLRGAAEYELLIGPPGLAIMGMDAQSVSHILVILLDCDRQHWVPDDDEEVTEANGRWGWCDRHCAEMAGGASHAGDL